MTERGEEILQGGAQVVCREGLLSFAADREVPGRCVDKTGRRPWVGH